MGKKKGLAAIFSRPKLAAAESPPWPWPSCATTPQTASFRGQAGGRHGDYDTQCSTTTTAGRCVVDAGPDGTGGRLLLLPPRSSSSKTAAPGDMYRTVNSVYLDDPADESCFSYFGDNEDESDGAEDDGGVDVVSFSTATASEEWSEAVIRSLGRSSTDRFFVEPPASNSILLAASRSPSPSPVWTPTPVAALQQRPKAPAASAAIMPSSEAESDINSVEEEEEQEHGQQHHEEEEARAPAATTTTSPLVEESVAVALDSEDPYRDFRASMEEMVAAHGLRDWPALQEMLLWYLRINAKHTHALIVGAFVDLLIGLAASSSTGSRSAGATTSATTISTSTSKAATTTSSSGSSSSSNSSVAGDGATTCSTAVTSTTMLDDEQCQCGGRGNSSGTDASCSPAAPSSDQEDEEDRPLGKNRASADELAFHVKLCP